MAGITLAEAQASLAAAHAEYLNALKVASFSIKDRSQAKQPLNDLLDSVKYWENRVRELTPRSRSRTRYGVVQ